MYLQRLACLLWAAVVVSGVSGCRVERVGAETPSPVSLQPAKAPELLRPNSPPLTPLRSLLQGAFSTTGPSNHGAQSTAYVDRPGVHVLVGTTVSMGASGQLGELGVQLCSALVAGADPVAVVADVLGKFECDFDKGFGREALIVDSEGRWGAAIVSTSHRSVAELAMLRLGAGQEALPPFSDTVVGAAVEGGQTLSPHAGFRLAGGSLPFRCKKPAQASASRDGGVFPAGAAYDAGHDGAVDAGADSGVPFSFMQVEPDGSVFSPPNEAARDQGPLDGGTEVVGSADVVISNAVFGSAFVLVRTAQGGFVAGIVGRSPMDNGVQRRGEVASPNLRLLVGPLGIVLVDPALARPAPLKLSSAPVAYAAMVADGANGGVAGDVVWMNGAQGFAAGIERNAPFFADLNHPEMGCQAEVSP